MTRWGWWPLTALSVALLGPLAVASLERPFQLWDHFTIPLLYLPYDVTVAAHFGRNLMYNLFESRGFVRPAYSAVANLEFLLFGGRFWLFYVVKWAAFLGSVYLVSRILRERGVRPPVRSLICAILLFHPVRFELMLFSADGWLTLFCLMALWMTMREPHPFDACALPPGRLALLFACWATAVGTKEAGLAFGAVWLAAAQWRSGLRWPSILRLSPFYATLAALAIRVLHAARYRTSNFESGPSGIHWDVIAGHLGLLAPDSRLHWMALVTAGLVAWTCMVLLRDPEQRLIGVVVLAWGTASLVLSSSAQSPAARYMIPTIYALSLAAGLGLQALPAHLDRLLMAASVLFPLAVAGDTYRQAIAYQQAASEASAMLRFAESKAREGYRVALTYDEKDLALEAQFTIKRFFERFGPLWYGVDRQFVLWQVAQTGLPQVRSVLLSARPPSDLKDLPGFTPSMLQSIHTVPPPRPGLLDGLLPTLTALERLAGRGDHTTYDLGAPKMDSRPVLYAYVLHPDCAVARSAAACPSIVDAVPEFLRSRPLGAGRVALEAGGTVRWRLPTAAGCLIGNYRTNTPAITTGLSNGYGHDIWNAPLDGDGIWHAFPQRMQVLPETVAGRYLFIFNGSQAGAEISLEEFRIVSPAAFEMAPGPNYGSFTFAK